MACSLIQLCFSSVAVYNAKLLMRSRAHFASPCAINRRSPKAPAASDFQKGRCPCAVPSVRLRMAQQHCYHLHAYPPQDKCDSVQRRRWLAEERGKINVSKRREREWTPEGKAWDEGRCVSCRESVRQGLPSRQGAPLLVLNGLLGALDLDRCLLRRGHTLTDLDCECSLVGALVVADVHFGGLDRVGKL